MSTPAIAFRPLQRADFALVSSWLDEPLVAHWWHDDSAPDAVEAQFGPCVDGTEPTDVVIVTIDEQPCGLIQRYAISSDAGYEAELAAICELPSGALSMDYFIGAPQLRGRGLGSAMITAFIALSWSQRREASSVIVAIAATNETSWRTLERAGFRRVGHGDMTPDNPAEPPDHVIYRIDRP